MSNSFDGLKQRTKQFALDPSTRAPALAGGASLGMSPQTCRGVVLSERSESKDDGSGAPGLPGGLHVIRLCDRLPQRETCRVIVKQLIRCGSSVGANYRAACRGRSVADFISKLSVVEEEADETLYWLELIEESGLSADGELKRLKSEASQLIAITVASKKTARANGLNRTQRVGQLVRKESE